MNKILIMAAFILAVASTMSTFAQDKTFFQTVEGKWKGTLEYKDYTSNERVTMNTIITFTPSADGSLAEVYTIYDDFGKIYKSNDKERIDIAARKFFDGDTEFAIESMTNGKLVLIGKTKDGNTVEPTRKTITVTDNTLTIIKETRDPWQFRHVYKLTRLVETKQPVMMLSVEHMRNDIDALKKTLVAIHPGVYRYNTPEQLEKEFVEARTKLIAPMSESDFFILISQLTNKLKCGHTFANPYNQNDQLKARLFDQRNYLPFYFKIIDGRMIVTANASSKNLSPGSEITKINGVAVKDIIEKLLTVTRGDGNSVLGHRINSLELTRGEAERFALFDWYFPLFFPVKDEIFDIEAVGFTSKKTGTFSVLAMTKAERTAEMAKRYGPSPTYDDGWKFEIQDGNLGYLKIDNSITWRLKTIKFKEFLANAFAELKAKKITNLVIDLRGNGGGDMDPGFELSRYLTHKKLNPYAESRRLVRNVAALPEIAKYVSTYSDELMNTLKKGYPANEFRKLNDKYFEIIGRENYPAVEPYPNSFDGKTYIIADASNASATFQFLDYVRQHKLATIVGQATGGNRQGINGGNYFFLSLPNSKIEIDIPVYFQAPLKQAPDESVIPNILVKREPDDIGNKLDRELAEIKRLISSKRAK